MGPAQPKKKRRWFLSAPFIGSAAFVVGILIGSAAAASGSDAGAAPAGTATVTAPAPTVTVTAEGPTTTKTVTAKPKPAPTKTVTAKAKPAPTKTVTVTAAPDDGGGDSAADGDIGDGTYLVGSEIKTGNYKSSGGGEFCYADTETKSGKILDQQVSQGAPVVIRITSQAYTFESNGCGSWKKVG